MDDKFGFCGLIWIISMFLLISVFKEWGFPDWLTIILSLIISLAIFTWTYIKWTK